MVAIVSGNSLGLNLTSLRTLGQQDFTGAAAHGRSEERSYVNIATGNLVVQQVDGYVAAHGEDIGALRTYNSRGLLNDDNGDNWSNGFYRNVLVVSGTLNAEGSTIRLTDRDGSVALYKYVVADAEYRTTDGDGAHDTIQLQAGNLVRKDGSTGVMQTYEGSGEFRLKSLMDPSGNTLVCDYDPVTGRLSAVRSGLNEGTHYTYLNGNLESVTTRDEANAVTSRVRYTYTDNRLATVTVDLSPENDDVQDGKIYRTTYTYEGSSKRISTITQTDGSQLTFGYDAATGKVKSVTDALNHTTTFTYGSLSTEVTSPLGHVTRYSYDANGQLTGIAAPVSTGAGPSRTFNYDSNGNVTRVVDEVGRAVAFEYDANGNQTRQQDSAGNLVSRTYQDNLLKTETIWLVADPDGAGTAAAGGPRTTRYVYDELGQRRLLFVVSAEGRVTEHRYLDLTGERERSITYTGAVYDSSGLTHTQTPTKAQVESWASQQVKTAVQLVRYTYDGRGELRARLAYASVDADGNGLAVGRTWERFVHDQAGRLLQAISGTGDITNYLHDGLGRITLVTDALGKSTRTEYFDASRETRTTFANGLTTAEVFNAGGLLTTMKVGPSGSLGVTTYFYDADNRLQWTDDPTGVRRQFLYDAAGRKTAEIDGNGTRTDYLYDASGKLIQVSTGDSRTWHAYDSAGRLTRTGVSAGPGVAVTERIYDGASRLAKVVQYATLVTESSMATLASMTVPAAPGEDRVTRYFYDGEGNLRGTLDAEGYLVVSRYDAGGRLEERIRYASRTPAAWRAAGTLAQLEPAPTVADPRDIHNVFFYDGQGRLVGEVDGENFFTQTTYDGAGRLESTRRYRNRVAGTVTPGAAFNQPAATVQDWLTHRAYDPLGRLSSETNPEGTSTAYTYDDVGNLTATTRAAATTDARATLARYDLQGRVIAELPPEGAARIEDGSSTAADAWATYGVVHAYDAAGRRVSTTDAHGHKTVFFYNEDGALRFQVNALGEVKELRYDDQGRRTQEIGYVERMSVAGLVGGLDATLVTAWLTSAPRELSRTTFVYRPGGSLDKTVDAAGKAITYGYNAFGEVVRTEQENGASGNLVRTQERDGRGLVTREVIDPAALALKADHVYDAFGRRTSSTDPNLWTRTQAFDRLGRVVTRQDALGFSSTTTYDAFGQVLTQVDALGHGTTFAYDVVTRKVTVTSAEGHETRTVRNRFGQVSSVTDAMGGVTTYTYDANGNLTQTTSPVGSISRHEYDPAGLLVKSWDANGNLVEFEYDGAERLLRRIVDPGGLNLITKFEYDGMGRQVKVTDPSNVATLIGYDRKGRVLTRTVDPGGLDLVTTYTYDAADRTLSVTDPGGTLTRYQYDIAGRLFQETVDPGGLGITKKWTYDANGNVETSTDANNHVTRYTYDKENRVTYTVIEGTGAVTRRFYDAAGNVVRHIAFASTLPPGGAPQDVAATLNDRVTSMAYDADNRLVFEVDALKGVVENVLDGNGRLVRRIAYANPVTSVPALGLATTLSNLRNLIVAAPSVDRSTRFGYDAAGRQVLSIDSMRGVTETKYDAAGNVVARISYAAPLAGPLGHAAGLAQMQPLMPVFDASVDRRTRYSYDAAGRMVFTIDPTGAIHETAYVKDRVQAVIRYGTRVQIGENWSLGNVKAKVALMDPAIQNQKETYSYDTAGRRWRTVDALGFAETLALDKAGRKVSFTNKKNDTWTYTYDAAGRLSSETSPQVSLSSMTASGAMTVSTTQNSVVTAFTYDGVGNLLTRKEASGRPEQRVTRYGYDAAGRQISVTYESVGIYDGSKDLLETETPLAPRSEKVVPLGTRTFYDVLGNAVANIDVGGALSQKTYDTLGRVTFEVDALGYVTGYERNSFGEAVSLTRYAQATTLAKRTVGQASDAVRGSVVMNHLVTGGQDRTLLHAYDMAGRRVQTREAATFYFDTSASTELQSGLGRKTTNNTYNAFGELVQVSTLRNTLADEWSSVSHYYDLNGRVKGVIDALGYVTSRTYDVFGNLSSVKEAAKALTAPWSTASFVTPINSVDDRATHYVYDLGNRKVEERRENVEYSTADDGTSLRGDLVTKFAYDAVGNLRQVTDALGFKTTTYFDALGRVIAVAAPVRNAALAGGTMAGASPLTIYRRDAHGNVVGQVDCANGATAVTLNSYAAGSASPADRHTLTRYDQLGRAIQVMDANGNERYSSFDAYGNVAKTWQKVSGRTTYTVHEYDKLGRLVETRKPASTMVLRGGIGMELVPDPSWAPMGFASNDKLSLSWSTLLSGTGDVRVDVSYLTKGFTYQAGENMEDVSVPAQTLTAEKVMPYGGLSGASGGMDLWLYGPVDKVRSIRVQQFDGVRWVTRWQGPPSAATGSSLAEIAQSVAGEDITRMRYNAFGEITARGDELDWLEYFDYDDAGRLWRTNAGDGVDVAKLFDLQGNVTAEIRSAGSGRNDLDVRALASAQQANSAISRRTELVYDAMGRLVQKSLPVRLEEQGGVAVQRMNLGISFTSGERTSSQSPVDGPEWVGTNSVTLAWNNLSSLGTGDIKFQVTYKTSFGLTKSRTSEILGAHEAAQGSKLEWAPGTPSDEDITQVTRVIVWKKDVTGLWRVVLDQNAAGNGANVIDLAAPGNLRATEFLELRLRGTTDWVTAGLIDFGDSRRYIGVLQVGLYDYRMGVEPPGEARRVVGTGTLQLKSDGTLVHATSDNQDVEWVRPVIAQTVDRWGNVLEMNDARSLDWKTRYQYNANNQLIVQTQPTAAGNIGATSPITRIYFDALGRQVAVRDAMGNVNGQAYDGGGSLRKEAHADGGNVTYDYDLFGRRIRTADALGNVTTFRYDAVGNLLAMVKAPADVYAVDTAQTVTKVGTVSIEETWTYDQLGRQLTHANGNGEITRYRYDLTGNVIEVKQPMGQKTLTAYDGRGHKLAQLDPNATESRWTYDYFGLLVDHQDLGGARYTYTYDNARQLTSQVNTRGQKLTYRYDAAGQMLTATDWDAGSKKVASYAYDLSGNRLRENITEGGVAYQDNHLGYDALGRLRDIADARVHMTLEYDKNGNRTRINTRVNYQGRLGETVSDVDRYYQYDAMNRQVVVGALDAAGTLMDDQTHFLTYDLNGNRATDQYLGTRIAASGTVPAIERYLEDGTAKYNEGVTFTKLADRKIKEVYSYDALNRLVNVERAGVQVDLRRYDAADRVVKSGAVILPMAYWELLAGAVEHNEIAAINRYVYRYDPNGQLLHQTIRNGRGVRQQEISWDPNELTDPADPTFKAAGYDDAGNVRGYTVFSVPDAGKTIYTSTFKRFESYQADVTHAMSNRTDSATAVQMYDTNGYLVGVDQTVSQSSRVLVNDMQGKALIVEQAGNVRRQLIVNGQAMGMYGVALDADVPWEAGGNPNFQDIADFNFSYSKVSASYPAPSPGAYTVQPGDSLQSIAQGAYGDASLWYLIAGANGLASSDGLRVGQTVTIPNRVGTVSNDQGAFKPYDPSSITGDLAPHMPMPDEGCGGTGRILMIVIAVVVSCFVPGIPGAILGSMLSQGFGVMTGTIPNFDWKAMGISVLTAGIASGASAAVQALSSTASTAASVAPAVAAGAAEAASAASFWASTPGVMTQMALTSVATQGILVATGLQDKFSWAAVAAAAVGAGVGSVIGGELGLPPDGTRPAGMDVGDFFARTALKSFSAGMATAVVRGGRISVENVAIDAFGNALGQGLVNQQTNTPPAANTPFPDADNTLYQPGRAQQFVDVSQFAFEGGGGVPIEPDRHGDVLVAAGDGFNMGQTPSTSVAIGAGPAPLSFDDLRRKEIQSRNSTSYVPFEEGFPTYVPFEDGFPTYRPPAGGPGRTMPIPAVDMEGHPGASAGAPQRVPEAPTLGDLRQQEHVLRTQAEQLAKASQWARDQGMTQAANEYHQAAIAASYGAMKAAGEILNINAANIASVPTQSRTTAFSPAWNTGEYSAGTPYHRDITLPDYVSVQVGAYVAGGGVSINLHNGDVFGQWSLGRAYPGYSLKPGLTFVTGYINDSRGAGDTSQFLGGPSAQAGGFVPTLPFLGVGGGLNHSYGGKTATEVGISVPPGVHVSPAGYGWQIKTLK